MTEERQKLIERFQNWLDTEPRKQIIASECANIAEEYHKEQLALLRVGSSTVLKYTDYKKEQALWIQQQNEKRTDRATNTEQFCIKCYWSYLNLIGHEKTETYEKIEQYLDNIGTYHLTTGDDIYDKGYDKKIADNINELMDKILE